MHLTEEGVRAIADGFVQLQRTTVFTPYCDVSIKGLENSFKDWLLGYRLFNDGEPGLPSVRYAPPSTTSGQRQRNINYKKRKISSLV